MESEFISLCGAACEADWAYHLVNELGLNEYATKPIRMFTDNQAALQFSVSNVESTRTKHIALRYHFLRDKISEGLLDLKYVPTAENVADILTKPLPRDRHLTLSRALGLCARAM